MADVKPNPKLALLRLELQKSELELSLKRMAVRKAELDDEMVRITENEFATHKAINNIDVEMKKFEGVE